jgi:energy-coupling factor transporter ATP-binding protein EcfA2
MNAISIKNIGPIEKLDIPLPPDGGVVVLRGANGAGKTTALEATQRVLGGNHQLSCRDGSERGTIDGLGVKITVGRSTRKTGDLEAIHLEGKLSIAELVDPGLKSPEAADAKRIKALVSLSDVDADERLFVQEIGEELYSVAVSNDKAGMDLLEMSARIKQDLQGYARRCEREAESHQGQAKAYKVAAGETFAVVENEADIKQRVVEATRKLTSLKETAAAGATLRAEADAAREYIFIEESITPKQLDKLREDQKFAADAVVQAEKALAAAKDAERKALTSLSHGERVAANVARYHKTIADAEGFAMPSLQEIFLAEMEA